MIEDAAGATRPDLGAIGGDSTEQGTDSVPVKGVGVFPLRAGIVRTNLNARRIGGGFQLREHVDRLPSDSLIERALQTACGSDGPPRGRRGRSQLRASRH